MTHHQGMPGSGLEDLPDSLASLGTALDVALCANLLRDSETVGPRDRSLVHPRQILDRLAVISEILLARDENDGQALAKVQHFRDPLCGVQLLLSRRPKRVCIGQSDGPFLERCRANRASRWRNK